MTSSVQFITLFCGGLALFAIGIIHACLPKVALAKKNTLSFFLTLGAVALAMSILRSAAWYVFGVVLLGWCTAAVMASAFFRSTLTRCLLLIPRRPWIPLSLLGIALAGGSVYYQERSEAQQIQTDQAYNSAIAYKPAMKQAPETALTDEGHPIALMVADQARSTEETTFWERHFLEGGNWYEHVIFRVPPNDHSNCHGWVFTNGNYWISPKDVESILKENHYEAVATPQVGDLAIYHEDSDVLLHSGIVRGMIDKDVLVESKWGTLGVYLHLAQNCIYGDYVTYYHSARQGHLLHGIKATPEGMNPTFIKHEQQ
jgi:hypothetical protein